MQNIKHSHINDRFRERLGRDFTQRDKREILNLIKQKKYIDLQQDDRAFKVFLKYENKLIQVVIDKTNGNFITAYIPYSIQRKQNEQ